MISIGKEKLLIILISARDCPACARVDRRAVTDGRMQVAAMKFLFHHGRNGVMRTVDLLISPVMTELQRVVNCIERGQIDAINGNSWFSKKVGLPWLKCAYAFEGHSA